MRIADSVEKGTTGTLDRVEFDARRLTLGKIRETINQRPAAMNQSLNSQPAETQKLTNGFEPREEAQRYGYG